jgi:hypothetical protein
VNAGKNHDIKIPNRCFENVSQLRYSGTTARNQNLIKEEIKRRLNLGNAWYHSVQNLFLSCLLSKNAKIRTYEIINFPVVLYGYETWSLTLRGEQRLKVFENRMFRRIFGPKRDEVTGGWRKLHNEELHNLYLKKEKDGKEEEEEQKKTKKKNLYRILVENQKERAHYEDIDVGGKIILK